MALKNIPYTELRVLLTKYLSTEEDDETAALIWELQAAMLGQPVPLTFSSRAAMNSTEIT